MFRILESTPLVCYTGMVWTWRNFSHYILCLFSQWLALGGPEETLFSSHVRSHHRADQVSRGQIASLLVGDFNMPIHEDSIFAAALHKKSWYNVANIGAPGVREKPTCHVGSSQGSQIDFILTNVALIDQFHNFQVDKISAIKDHSLLQVDLHLPCPMQTRASLRNPIKLPELVLPTPEDDLLSCQLGRNFDSLIRNGQVDKAFDAWAREANRILLHVAKSQGFQNDTQRAQRGKIVFHAQRRHPPAIGAQASTLQTRRLWKAYNRATEVSMAVDGTRRQRT